MKIRFRTRKSWGNLVTVAIMALPFAASPPAPPFSRISSEGCFCDNVGRPCILFRLSFENSVNAVSRLFSQGPILEVGNCRGNAEFCTSVYRCCRFSHNCIPSVGRGWPPRRVRLFGASSDSGTIFMIYQYLDPGNIPAANAQDE